jgi:hypothetical protein
MEVAMKKLLVPLLFLAATARVDAGAYPEVDYPQGYRDWRHVKSMVIQQGHPLFDSFGGIHHIYANAVALEGYRLGNFPDGAVLVFDLLEAKAEPSAIVEGERKVVGVMQKDSRKFATTGGWGFEGFAGGAKDQRVVGAKAAEACYQCHTQQKAHDFVFSTSRD